jgi:rhamnogalacturonyl hydrolase YesR
MQMPNKLDQQPAPHKDDQWASQAVADLMAGIKLNQRLVETGIWDQLIADMKTDAELEAYGIFLYGLRDSMVLAKRIRGD